MLINDIEYKLGEKITVEELMDNLVKVKGFEKYFKLNKLIVVNGEFIKESDYDKIHLKESDQITIIPRMAGG